MHHYFILAVEDDGVRVVRGRATEDELSGLMESWAAMDARRQAPLNEASDGEIAMRLGAQLVYGPPQALASMRLRLGM